MAEQINIELKGFDKIQEQLNQTEASVTKLKSSLDLKQGADSIKGLGTAAADTGAKTGGLSGAFKNLKDGVMAVPGPLGAATQGFGALSKAGLAFVANPIGATIAGLVAIFAILKKALNSTEEGTFALNKIMGGFSGLLKPVIKLVGDLAAFLADKLVAAMEGAAKVAKLLGIDLLQGAEDGIKLADSLNKIEDAEGKLAEKRAEANRDLVLQREILTDINATYDQKLEALGKIKASEEAFALKEKELAEQRKAAAELAIKLEGESIENADALEKAKIAVFNAEANLYEKRIFFNREEKKLAKEAEAEEKEREKAREERAKARAARIKEGNDFDKMQKQRADLEELKSEFEKELALNQIAKQAELKRIEELGGNTKQKNERRAEAEKSFQKQENEIVNEYTKLRRDSSEKESEAEVEKKTKARAKELEKEYKDREEARINLAKDTITNEEDLAAEISKIKIEELGAYVAKVKSTEDQLAKDSEQRFRFGATKVETIGLVSWDKIIKGQDESEEDFQKRRIQRLKETLDTIRVQTIDNQVLTDGELLELQKEYDDLVAEQKREALKKEKEERIANEQAIINASIETATTAFNAIRDLRKISLDNQLSDLEENKSKELAVDGLTEQAKYEIELKYYEQSEALKEQAFKSDQRLQYALAFIDLAKMITSTLAQYPKFDGGIAMTAALISQTAVIVANIAKIAATKYQPGPKPQPPKTEGGKGSKFEQGGLLSGPSHSMGGIKTAFAEMEGNEFVVNRRATSAFLPILETINNAGRYTSNGVPGPAGIAPIFKTYVVASDVSTQQEMDRKIMDSARL
jgi:hypothetical protein